MESLSGEYRDRVVEIQSVFDFISVLQDDECLGLNEQIEQLITGELSSILSIINSSILVMLYNLIESTAVGCVEHLYDQLRDKNISYNSLNAAFKDRIFKDLKVRQIKSTEFISSALSSGLDSSIISSSYSKENYFNGNVDAKKIKDIFKVFQLNFVSGRGGKLVDVKDARKMLTHSESSFEKYGRNFSRNDLKIIIEDTIMFFDEFLIEFEKFIENQNYLAVSLNGNVS